MLSSEKANDLLGFRAQLGYESIHKDLAKRGTNLTLLLEEYETKARNVYDTTTLYPGVATRTEYTIIMQLKQNQK